MTTRTRAHAEPILSARGIVNRFGRQVVHDKLSLDVVRGEIIGIAGGSGSGKSVLLKTLVGLHQPDAGQVLINGKAVQAIGAAEKASLICSRLRLSRETEKTVTKVIKQHMRLFNLSASGGPSKNALYRYCRDLGDAVPESLLLAQPASGRPGRVIGTRELVIGGLPYVVPYRVRDNDIEILRVLHTSRRFPGAL